MVCYNLNLCVYLITLVWVRGSEFCILAEEEKYEKKFTIIRKKLIF